MLLNYTNGLVESGQINLATFYIALSAFLLFSVLYDRLQLLAHRRRAIPDISATLFSLRYFSMLCCLDALTLIPPQGP